jgi:hypothetical protein
MSRRKPRGDECAPAMFPFLAVLLCTIGALVLILVISVVHSHASAKRDMDQELHERVEQAQEESDFLQTISQELAARREKAKQEIDRRRKELTNVEDHILRLKAQMDQLRARAEGMESEGNRDDQTRIATERAIADLKTQIDAKRNEIAKEVQKSKTKKLAFSIIPYDGPNGTSRRPVYLECRADGVVIQPEGILIPIKDLRPPYGPGNPVDSALRVLRSAYQKRDATFGLTIPPYPLLVVRPDGVHTYAMTRAAMSGWDDQFGYELINADMPLVFPPGVPHLKEELLSTLEASRKRQETLIASLPRQHARARELDDIDLHSLSPEPPHGDRDPPSHDGPKGKDSGEWKMIDEIDSRGISNSGGPGNSSLAMSEPIGNQFSRVGGLSEQGSAGASNPAYDLGSPSGAKAGTTEYFAGGSSAVGASGGESFAGQGAEGSGSDPSGSDPSGNGGSSAGNTANAMQAPSRANAFSSGTATGMASQTMSPSSGPPNPESESMENALREMQRKENEQQDGSVSYKQNVPKSNDESSKPIASSKGKGWATPGRDAKATPVTRPIRIVALNDRWLIRKEGSETQFDSEIQLALGPKQAGSTLEKSIRNRVDSWGLSLPGGYWCPSITIESATDAQQSVERLRRLLDGSGVDVRVVPLQSPSTDSKPSSSVPPKR